MMVVRYNGVINSAGMTGDWKEKVGRIDLEYHSELLREHKKVLDYAVDTHNCLVDYMVKDLKARKTDQNPVESY